MASESGDPGRDGLATAFKPEPMVDMQSPPGSVPAFQPHSYQPHFGGGGGNPSRGPLWAPPSGSMMQQQHRPMSAGMQPGGGSEQSPAAATDELQFDPTIM